MHEASLIESLIEQVERIVAERGGGTVAEIEVELGPLSGAEPMLLDSAFEQLRCGSCAEAALKLHVVPLVVHCDDCHRPSEREPYDLTCPLCGSGETRVVQGEILLLRRLTVDQATANDGP